MGANWIVVPCLLKLRDEFNALSPNRDKGADGTVGDLAHQQEPSDHNPDANGWVKALDIDSTGPWPTAFHALVMFIVGRCRTGAEKRIRYVIHDRMLYHVDDKFAGRAYTGADPHTNHAHFSSTRDVSLFKGVAAWGLLNEFGDDDMAFTTDDKNWLGAALGTKFQAVLDRIAAMEAALPQEVWDGPKIKNAYSGAMQSPATMLSYAPSRTPILDVGAKVDTVNGKVDQLVAAAGLEAAEVPASPDQIADAVLLKLGAGGQSPDQIAELLAIALGKNAAAVGAALQARSAA